MVPDSKWNEDVMCMRVITKVVFAQTQTYITNKCLKRYAADFGSIVIEFSVSI